MMTKADHNERPPKPKEDDVLRKMLNTPPAPKHKKAKKKPR